MARSDSEDRVLGLILSQRTPGQVASLLPPYLDPLLDSRQACEIEDALLRSAMLSLSRPPVHYVQVLLPLEEASRHSCLRRNGFERITEMQLMIGVSINPEGITQYNRELFFRPYSQVLADHFARTLHATYHESLDVPETGVDRTPEELLTDLLYGSPGQNSWWLIEDTQQEAVGVLVANPPNELKFVELLYLGVLPSRKRQGIGRAAMRYLLAEMQANASQFLHLGVDCRNIPAVELYTSIGLVPYRSQEVFLWRPKPI